MSQRSNITPSGSTNVLKATGLSVCMIKTSSRRLRKPSVVASRVSHVVINVNTVASIAVCFLGFIVTSHYLKNWNFSLHFSLLEIVFWIKILKLHALRKEDLMWAAIDVFSIFLFQLTLWTATGQQILIEIWEDFSKAKLIHLILLMTVSWTNDKVIGSFDKNLSRNCFSSWKLFFFNPVHAGFQNLASPPRVSSGRVTTLQKKKIICT